MNVADSGTAAVATKTGAALYFITGSSGSGKTTLLKEVAATNTDPRWTAHHLDDHGVPTAQEIDAAGGGWAWQAVQVQKWIDRALRDDAMLVVDGQARPSDVLAKAKASGLANVHVVVIDCDREERRRRLMRDRRQDEYDNPHIYAWAAYLAGQAHALDLEVIDTSAPRPRLRAIFSLRALRASERSKSARSDRFCANAGLTRRLVFAQLCPVDST